MKKYNTEPSLTSILEDFQKNEKYTSWATLQIIYCVP